MKARLAYLTTNAGRFFLNFQIEGETELRTLEISRAHLTNICIDGVAVLLRQDQFNRVPQHIEPRTADERAGP